MNLKKPQFNPDKKKLSTADIILIGVGLYVLIRTPWGNMNSFHYLLFFLYIFCMMMRLTNIRKQHSQREKMEQEKQRLALQAHEEKKDGEFTEIEESKEGEASSVDQELIASEKDSQS